MYEKLIDIGIYMTYGDLIRGMDNKQLSQFIVETVEQEINYFFNDCKIRSMDAWEKFLDLNCEGFNNIFKVGDVE